MKKDIVDRMIELLHAQRDPKGEALIAEAVAEIENLRGALDYYADRKPSPYVGTGPYDPATHDPGSVARAALGEEK